MIYEEQALRFYVMGSRLCIEEQKLRIVGLGYWFWGIFRRLSSLNTRMRWLTSSFCDHLNEKTSKFS